MSTASFYSDRTAGPRPRDLAHLPDATWRGLLAAIQNKINSDWLAAQFPEMCPDGNGVVGTNRVALFDLLQALIPDMDWPPPQYATPDTSVALDLVDFVAQRIAKPEPKRYHNYYKHHELEFDTRAGRAELREEINLLFARGGVAFELGPDMRVSRLGPPEGRQVLADLRPATGDSTLDDLIVEARARYLSRDPRDVRVGVEKLWDAFERLKTIEGGSKRASVTALLDQAASGTLRQALEGEARALTDLGNQLQIRHFESGKDAVDDADVDYLYIRMAAFVLHVLRATGRLAA